MSFTSSNVKDIKGPTFVFTERSTVTISSELARKECVRKFVDLSKGY